MMSQFILENAANYKLKHMAGKDLRCRLNFQVFFKCHVYFIANENIIIFRKLFFRMHLSTQLTLYCEFCLQVVRHAESLQRIDR